MPLKNKLNQYELDSVLAILRSKALPLEKLKSKTIAVSGGGALHRMLVYAFLHLNEVRQLGLKVISVGERIDTLYEDDDYAVAELSQLAGADYFIECGFLRYNGDTDSRVFRKNIDMATMLSGAFSGMKPGRVILLSSTACYGAPEREMSLSEGEYADQGFGDLTAAGTVGRILSVILGVYGIIVVSLITSVIVNFYIEVRNNPVDAEETEDETEIS